MLVSTFASGQDTAIPCYLKAVCLFQTIYSLSACQDCCFTKLNTDSIKYSL